jgi:hypothetical protein
MSQVAGRMAAEIAAQFLKAWIRAGALGDRRTCRRALVIGAATWAPRRRGLLALGARVTVTQPTFSGWRVWSHAVPGAHRDRVTSPIVGGGACAVRISWSFAGCGGIYQSCHARDGPLWARCRDRQRPSSGGIWPTSRVTTHTNPIRRGRR